MDEDLRNRIAILTIINEQVNVQIGEFKKSGNISALRDYFEHDFANTLNLLGEEDPQPPRKVDKERVEQKNEEEKLRIAR